MRWPTYRAESAVGAARAVVALHGTDPATTVLSALARTDDASPSHVERALYDDRERSACWPCGGRCSVPRQLAAVRLVGASDLVATQQRKLLLKLLAESCISGDLEVWLDRAELVALTAIEAAGEITSTDLAQADPLLATRVHIGTGKYAATPSVASRLMTLLSAEGKVVRTRPRGGWTSTQFRWSTMASWCDLGELPDLDTAITDLARRWLHAYGPATLDDLQWWTGWTKTRTRAAVAPLDTVEVEADGRPAWSWPTTSTRSRRPSHGSPSCLRSTPRRWAGSTATSCWGHIASGSSTSTATPARPYGSTAGSSAAGHNATTARWSSVSCRTSGRRRPPRSRSGRPRCTTMLGDVRLKARARGWTDIEKDLRT